MKTFTNMAAQGDFIIIRRAAIPDDCVEIPAENGVHTIAHSETGHNHVMVAEHARAYELKRPDIYTLFLQVDETAEITHQRGWDTHEPIMVSPGIYEVRRQREYTPEGFRRAQD